MTDFNQSKLSQIIARRIITPEDRSMLLPFSTPIYCPNYNGVVASRVTVINPNTNSFNVSTTLENTVGIGTSVSKSSAEVNPSITKNGTLTVDELGIATGFSSTNYISIEDVTTKSIDKIHAVEFIPSSIESAVNLVSVTAGGVVYALAVQPNGNITFTSGTEEAAVLGTATLGRAFLVDLDINGETVVFTVKNTSTISTSINIESNEITLVTFGASSDANMRMDLAKAFYVVNGERSGFYFSGITASDVTSINNIFDINLTQQVSRTYFVPHEVDLESQVDLIEMIKSDFGVQFKKAISNAILAQIQTLITAGSITSVTMGDTMAATLGTVIADNVINGTGQHYSIYKYNNGAPVTCITSSAQPDYDKMIYNQPEYMADFPASKNDVAVPAMCYFEKPTLILPSTSFTEVEQGLCSGSIKRHAIDKINIDTAAVDFSPIGEGIFGTNDTFAVAFTEPSITRTPNKDLYGDDVCITVFFGIRLVHLNNLRVLEKNG